MLGAFRAPVSGMVANQQMLDVIANNLANINTPAFKQNRTVFQDLVYQRMTPTGDFASVDAASLDPNSPLQDRVGAGVGLGATATSFETGPMMQDGDPLHMAVQ